MVREAEHVSASEYILLSYPPPIPQSAPTEAMPSPMNSSSRKSQIIIFRLCFKTLLRHNGIALFSIASHDPGPQPPIRTGQPKLREFRSLQNEKSFMLCHKFDYLCSARRWQNAVGHFLLLFFGWNFNATICYYF